MTIHIGILGAARIVPSALIKPAQHVADVEIYGIAARNPQRAHAFAQKYHIPHTFQSYEEMLNDATIDAVYVPLPNSLHAEWSIQALKAGKHVLCEKPFASNANEAQQMATTAAESQRVLMEAFHYRYHPLAARMREIVSSGELGKINRIEASLCFPLPSRNDIRYNLALGGGSAMDAGAYTVNLLRFLAGSEPEVTQASALLASPGVDRRMDAEFLFPDGVTGHMTSSLFSKTLLKMDARVSGDQGSMYIFNFIAPQAYHRLTVRTSKGKRTEHIAGEATYTYQLRAFAQAILTGAPMQVDPADSIANMRVIDAIYRKAGLQPRGNIA